MTNHRFTVEYRTKGGGRRRVVYLSDMNGLRWVRREDVYEEGQWVQERHEQITAPSFEVVPFGDGSFAGP